ncbi:hypothetical protein MCOR02_008471 [Pyricularia oryzae]|uniref:Uncharacterized protein n=2 Tax=Pyricularia TaxID=48558 RepID=A0ABQ8NVS4_PYRGI|nr:hypothetical protein MCOR02_008471 [Pyricularia oryzae]KAI6302752.1 hypothetical protein MCOR33_002021 [Pyricularia grisea]KAI6306382.1 hypothetical protein MCOR29_010144 [Pyricularia oryzae]QBZ61132.1 hypothetical protein PoMZ_08078 [Pyricularia oryzae]
MVGKLGRVDDNFEDWMDPCMEARTRRLLPSIKEVSAHCKISATACYTEATTHLEVKLRHGSPTVCC